MYLEYDKDPSLLTEFAHIALYHIMRLINVDTYEIHESFGNEIPEYAILSHTWDEEEVTFQDMQHLDDKVKKKRGFKKIVYSCEQAKRDELEWAWVDTCCIDKTSSAELTEAINSMHVWYSNSNKCYAYLRDVPPGDDPFPVESYFRRSRWFTRGWTLQELVAPREVGFYHEHWRIIGTKYSIESGHYREGEQDLGGNWEELLENITGIPKDCLVQRISPSMYSVAQRMCWASARQCTRVEDVAYCLIGIFKVNMPLLYGEGVKAFVRLQEEIMKEIDDHSLFAWTVPEGNNQSWMVSSIFAQSPASFARSHTVIPIHEELGDLSAVTRKGLRMSLCLRPADFPDASHLHQKNRVRGTFYAVLNCAQEWDTSWRIALLLIPVVSSTSNQLSQSFYRYARAEHLLVTSDDELRDPKAFRTIYIRKNVPPEVLQIFSPLVFSKQRFSRHDYSGPDALTSVYNLASVLLDLGKCEEAEALYRQALKGRVKVLGEEHPSTIASAINLAEVLKDLGKYREAEAFYRRSLEGREKVLGREHPDTLTSVSNLASVLPDLGKYEEAEALYRRVLDGRVKIFGERHASTLASVSNLALVLKDLGKYEDAEACHRRALEGRETVLAKIHPDTLTSVSNLALVLQDLGKFEEAEALHQRALEGRTREFGEEHPSTLISVKNLELVLRDLGKFEEAEAVHQRALKGMVKELGKEHPSTLEAEAFPRNYASEFKNDVGYIQR
jgi:tetratricopeptide (TPR) repeat protein